jgi:Fe2+ transport system protein FeoA
MIALSTDPADQYPQVAWMSDDKHADRSQPGRMPASGYIASLSWPNPQRVALNRASKVFSQHFLERRDIHHLLSQQLLELGILNLKRLQLFRVRHLHAAILGSPLVKRRITDAMLTAKLLAPSPA